MQILIEPNLPVVHIILTQLDMLTGVANIGEFLEVLQHGHDSLKSNLFNFNGIESISNGRSDLFNTRLTFKFKDRASLQRYLKNENNDLIQAEPLREQLKEFFNERDKQPIRNG